MGKKKAKKEASKKAAAQKKKQQKKERKKVKDFSGKKEHDSHESGDVPPPKRGMNPHEIDIRVGLIKSVKKHPSAKKLLVEEIDIGEKKPRTICSGLRGKIDMKELEGKLVPVMTNLKPLRMLGILSNGMVMVAHVPESEDITLVNIPEGAEPGERIIFEGITCVEPSRQIRGDRLEMFKPYYRSDEKGVMHWYNLKAKTEDGEKEVTTSQPNMIIS